MANKPFTNKPDEKMERMVEAASHVLSAIKALEGAMGCSEHWAEYSSLQDCKKQLEQFMSCDQGEAGFEPYMLSVSEKVFRGRRNPIKDAMELSR